MLPVLRRSSTVALLLMGAIFVLVSTLLRDDVVPLNGEAALRAHVARTVLPEVTEQPATPAANLPTSNVATSSPPTAHYREASSDRITISDTFEPAVGQPAARLPGAESVRAELGPNDWDEWVGKRDGNAPFIAAERRPAPRSIDAIREGGGSAFRHDLEWSEWDHETARRHARAAEQQLDPVAAYFSLLADTDTPLMPWKKVATPISCQGREFYSGHFSIPPENIVRQMPRKTQDWAAVVPGRKETYIFKSEGAYRRDLIASRLGLTRRRYGFATNRNLELMAAGCVPYFCGIHRVPREGTLDSLPKSFFEKILMFPGVRAVCNPPKRATGLPLPMSGAAPQFNDTRFHLVASKMLDFTRAFQTTTHFAKYVLSATSLKTVPRSALVIWASHYSIMLTGFIHGLRELGVEVVDVPRRTEIYHGALCEAARLKTYAKGWFFYCKAKESPNVTRDDIERRIWARAFDMVILSITDTLTYHLKDPSVEIPFFDAITSSYPPDLIVSMNDADLIRPMTADVASRTLANRTRYFKRETHGCREGIW